MSADLLRRAAMKAREVAEAATPGPWEAWSGATAGGGEYVSARSTHGNYTFGVSPGEIGERGYQIASRDAAHIALWHPGVALAAADWLDEEADEQERLGSVDEPNVTPSGARAYVVARLLLGEADV